MKLNKSMQAFCLLLVMALLGAMFVPAVSAAEEKNSDLLLQNSSEAIFEIIGNTTDLKTQVDPESKSTDILENKYGKLNIPSTVLKYDIVQFSKADVKTDKTNSLKVSIYGKEYDLILEKMNFEDIDDGIDSYSGYVKGLDDSIALFTFDESMDKSLIYGSIQLKDEIIFIEPVQNREYTMKTVMPLHIVYSSKDMEQPDESLIDMNKQKIMNLPTKVSGDQMIASDSTKSWKSVYVLVATDNEFYGLGSNWVSAAQSYMAQAAYQYQRSDIGVSLYIAKYDSSKKDTLSSSSRKFTDPLGLFKDTFSPNYLDGKNADIAIYLGGNDRSGNDAGVQGSSWGYSCYDNPEHPEWHDYCRYAWSQMVADSNAIDIFYDGSYHARLYCIIHEIGHIFDANHEGTGVPNQAYTWFTPGLKTTVMYSMYLGSGITTWEYSSPSYHGNSDCNNAGAINAVKQNIAGLV
ncbi:zinc-dependent metalloprotease [Methanomicrobium antiquum]|uniref:Zinc-dependent metalloprotease n=1 Tax=Methanomicrobium antiquum TaxID=487686 RepID=A0AAF0FRA0_9EURY|nr:M12 family metallo-peptidase [Methanomicrobium antiquum]WFN36396.1 zinc-dependent metalloprotease [Methanomicrobium antiquum]